MKERVAQENNQLLYMMHVLQECVFEVSMAAEAFLELLHMHYGRVLLASAAHISKAESVLRAAAKTEDELRRLCAPSSASYHACHVLSV